MGKSMLIREIPVYSEEFDIHGVIKDYGVVTKLFFTYENRDLSRRSRNLQLHYW